MSLAACPTAAPRPEPVVSPEEAALRGVSRGERPFLVDPLAGYPLVTAPEAAARVRAGWAELARTGDPAAARELASGLLAADRAFHPARVLASQADFLAGDDASAMERLGSVVEELPGYTAAQLLRGRAAERLGRIVEAFASYLAAAEDAPAAAARAEALRARAVEIVANRFADALRRGLLEEAGAHLARLDRWAPEDEATLEGAFALAGARGDRRAELAAAVRLLGRFPDRRELELRRAELEIEVGDASQGLQILQRLAERDPADPRLQERLEQAKFEWRLTLLPAEVRAVSHRPQLTRGELATLIHWLVPRVRTTRAPAGRIAGDILEHPRREEIARVVNLGLMDVDPTLHTFSPERPVRRATAIAALLLAVETLGAPAPCLAGPLGRNPSQEAVCGAAARCALIGDPTACRPGDTLSGREALELVRRALQHFSAS